MQSVSPSNDPRIERTVNRCTVHGVMIPAYLLHAPIAMSCAVACAAVFFASSSPPPSRSPFLFFSGALQTSETVVRARAILFIVRTHLLHTPRAPLVHRVPVLLVVHIQKRFLLNLLLLAHVHCHTRPCCHPASTTSSVLVLPVMGFLHPASSGPGHQEQQVLSQVGAWIPSLNDVVRS